MFAPSAICAEDLMAALANVLQFLTYLVPSVVVLAFVAGSCHAAWIEKRSRH
jgi:hypothetical protein